ncbi:MAG: DUF1801 domain-containing protein [Pseudolysinimonas sp.]
MAESKTRPTDVPVEAFIAGVDEPRRTQSQVIRDLMDRATGTPAVMWGPSIVGYGTTRTGTGEWPVVGFSPRKGALTLYVLGGVDEEVPLLEQLGPHTTGVSCLYLKKLDGVDLAVLERLVRLAWSRAR